MIGETALEIGDLYKRWQAEMDSRYARRNKIRYIDFLLNELEVLNLADSTQLRPDLRRQVKSFLQAAEHPLGGRAEAKLTIADTMEALYDIQDTLLLGGEDDEEL